MRCLRHRHREASSHAAFRRGCGRGWSLIHLVWHAACQTDDSSDGIRLLHPTLNRNEAALPPMRIWSQKTAYVGKLFSLLLQQYALYPHAELLYSVVTHTFNSPFSGTTWVSRYQKGKTNLDFTEARDNEWQWHRLGYMQVCTSLQTANHASTPPLSSLQARCPSCHPTNSVKALKAIYGVVSKVVISAFVALANLCYINVLNKRTVTSWIFSWKIISDVSWMVCFRGMDFGEH